jgi:hypothetical protein
MAMMQMQLVMRASRITCGGIDAATGVRGLRKANRILQKYNTAGLLIGGLAKAIWSNPFDHDEMNDHKDIDVIVLSHDCRHHPKQWEGGIDWWVSHSFDELPNNGNIYLDYNIQIDPSYKGSLFPGLYLCCPTILEEIVRHERMKLGRQSEDFASIGSADLFYQIPLIERNALNLNLSQGEKVPCHCKPLKK